MSFTAFNRRRFLAGTAAAGLAGALAACGYQEDKPNSGGESGGTWSYTDDRDRKLNGPTPKRIVAQVSAAAALWEFGIKPIGIFGPSKLPDGSPDPEVGDVDLSKVTSLGNVWGEFNYDAYVGLKPDLLVSIMYQNDELWYVPAQQVEQVEKTAPTVGVDVGFLAMLEGIEKFRVLAKALGGDVDAPSVTEQKTAFERTDQAFGEAVKGLGGKRVMIVSATRDSLYVGKPEAFPASKHFLGKGMQIVQPEQTTDGAYWEQLSWENAGKYPADVILYDARAENLQGKELDGFPTWTALPAVQAGRATGWNPATPFSYRAFGKQLTALTETFRNYA